MNINRKECIVAFKKQEQSISDKLDELFMLNPLTWIKFIEYCYEPSTIRLEKDIFSQLAKLGLIRPITL